MLCPFKMLWCFLQGLHFFGESHLAKAGGWVKSQLVCNHLLLNHIPYTENFIPVSFLFTCKEASRDFYCSAHWFSIGTLNMYRGDQNKQTRYNWTHCSTPVTMMWKQWCQAPKQQGCNSKKLGASTAQGQLVLALQSTGEVILLPVFRLMRWSLCCAFLQSRDSPTKMHCSHLQEFLGDADCLLGCYKDECCLNVWKGVYCWCEGNTSPLRPPKGAQISHYHPWFV